MLSTDDISRTAGSQRSGRHEEKIDALEPPKLLYSPDHCQLDEAIHCHRSRCVFLSCFVDALLVWSQPQCDDVSEFLL